MSLKRSYTLAPNQGAIALKALTKFAPLGALTGNVVPPGPVVKLFIAGLLVAVACATVLTIILVVGSILAGNAWITLLLTIVWLILKATLRRVT
jgi:hypothetical protein